jgi:hypothetical protein
VDVVVVHHASGEALARCLAALERQSNPAATVTVVLRGTSVSEPAGLLDRARVLRSEHSSVEAARAAALAGLEGEWVCFLDEEDVPEQAFLETLLRAQAASGADVVSCGLRLHAEQGPPREYLFAGQPRALGLLANGYGTVSLLRRSLLGELTGAWPVEGDPDWPLLARLSASGAEIVSVPAPLVARSSSPGTLESHPSDALLVVEELERTLPEHLASAVRLAAGLAADAQEPAAVSREGGLARRAIRRLARSVR